LFSVPAIHDNESTRRAPRAKESAMQASIANVISIAPYLRAKSASPMDGEQTRPCSTTTAARPARRSRTSSNVASIHDDDIVERVTMGDVDAARELRARYIGPMRRAARVILRDAHEAARIADAALEEACDGWPPERGRVDRWLLRLARRAAVARRKTLWGVDNSH
jgi:hypothetical protein